MDILDIMLAKALTPQGQTDIYVNKANKAAAKAAQAEQDAATAIATVEAAADTIAAAQEDAADLLEAAQEALQTAEAAQINMPEVYSTTGQNTDGYMTQKAVTDALAEKQASITTINSTLQTKADKSYVDNAIRNIPSGSGNGSNIQFSTDDAGKLVVINEEGHLAPGELDETTLIDALANSGVQILKDTIGLEMDYANKTFKRTQSATRLNMGNDFNKFPMYGGRMRCNVADDGTITAFYGDAEYRDDGSNGQVMIYQPKFYYQRVPLMMDNAALGYIVRQDSLLLSANRQANFKVAPIFVSTNEELDYVLFSAYEAGRDGDRLTSIANVKPVSNMTITAAENYAKNRGEGWHIINYAAEATNQMLEMVEFGSMNGQTALELGICNIENVANINCSSLTGSTSTLGNSTGYANATISEINGTSKEETVNGKRAISYRGMENPWGNIWKMIQGILIYGDGHSQGGTPYICDNYTYATTPTNNYTSVGFNLPSSYGWISGMGYGNNAYDWVFLPAECSNLANSLLPVGDQVWVVTNNDKTRTCVFGGSWNQAESNGPFDCGADRILDDSARPNYGTRLMYIPTKNTIYANNIAKWQAKMGE